MTSNIYENDMKGLSSEEKVTYYYWFVLDKIKKELELRGKDDTPIVYTVYAYPTVSDSQIPNQLTEKRIIEKLTESNVIEEIIEETDFQVGGDDYSNPDSAGTQYFLRMNQKKFNEIYEKYKELTSLYEVAEEKGNTLTFNVDGEVSYISPDGKKYEAKLSTYTNPYKLLRYLVEQQTKEIYKFPVLAKVLREEKIDSSSGDERRVRDTVSSIKKALGYHGDDLIISDKGFGINPNCTVNIIRVIM